MKNTNRLNGTDMSKAYLHINGITYELADEIPDRADTAYQSVEDLVNLISDPKAQVQHVSVLVDGRKTELLIAPQRVFAAGVTLDSSGDYEIKDSFY